MRSQKNELAKGGFFSNLRYDAKKNPMLLVMMIPSVAFFLVFNLLCLHRLQRAQGSVRQPLCGAE